MRAENRPDVNGLIGFLFCPETGPARLLFLFLSL
jgi:hypothetical protein